MPVRPPGRPGSWSAMTAGLPCPAMVVPSPFGAVRTLGGPRPSTSNTVSGRLPRLLRVGACPVEEVEHLLLNLDDGNLIEERRAVGAAVAGAVREAGGAGVGAADRAVHGPAQQRPVAGPDGRRGVDRVAAPV